METEGRVNEWRQYFVCLFECMSMCIETFHSRRTVDRADWLKAFIIFGVFVYVFSAAVTLAIFDEKTS